MTGAKPGCTRSGKKKVLIHTRGSATCAPRENHDTIEDPPSLWFTGAKGMRYRKGSCLCRGNVDEEGYRRGTNHDVRRLGITHPGPEAPVREDDAYVDVKMRYGVRLLNRQQGVHEDA